MARKNKKSLLKNLGHAKYIAAALVLVILAAFAWHWHSNKKAQPASSTAATEVSPKKTAASNPTTTKSQSGKSPVVSDTSPTHLSAPDRVTYASNHSPSSASDTEISTFVTTPGATGTITFTNGTVEKELPTQTAKSDGTVTWYWKPSQIGLFSGSWKISAVTSLGNQTKTSYDVINLVLP